MSPSLPATASNPPVAATWEPSTTPSACSIPDATCRTSVRASAERGGTTPQGRQFYKLAEAEIARGNWAAAARNLQTALTFEPANALFKERLAQAKQALR